MLKAGLVIAIAGLAIFPAAAGATTYNVNTTADGFLGDGKCGLREAIEAANENQKQSGCPKGESKRDVIVLKGTTYSLTVPTTNENVNANGDLDLNVGGPITVRGVGSDISEITTGLADRVFDLNNLSSSLRLEKVQVNSGDVTSYGGFDGFGGTIRSIGRLTIDRAQVNNGDADSGGAVYSGTALNISRSRFSGNDAIQSGGTLFFTADATIKRAAINSSDAGGGTADAAGGALYMASGEATISDSSIRGSSADGATNADGYGGAVFVDGGTFRLIRSEISNNGVTATTNGDDELGAGLYLDGGTTATVINTTLFGNQAAAPDGAAGAIYNGGTLEVQHSTLYDNFAASFGDQLYTTGTTTIGRSIVNGDNTDDPCSGATFVSDGFNVAEFDDPSCNWGPSDAEDGNITMGSLQENGGPTQTLAFNPGASGIDFVPKGECRTITKSRDQRGFVRPNTKKVNGKRKPQPCDSGAFEQGAKAP
jgi:CSLREA domain-containing protein